ncbi:MAG: hypothetical protein HY088_03670 [Ignavibacteriales bacterium]|nr:hypothetical protein [Ignavibacteriales bacterium]
MKSQTDTYAKTPNKYASLSLVSTIVTATLTSIHHAYEIGFAAVILVLLFIVSPALLMRGFRNTGKKGFLWAYGLLSTWLVVGLGLVDGLWNHIIRPLGFQLHALLSLHSGGTKVVEKAFEGNFIYEGTGMLTFVASMVAAYYGYKFIRMSRQSEITSVQNN